MMKFTISPASKKDADFIADGIMTAIGQEICQELGKSFLPGSGTVKSLFSKIASLECSQYSYHNALIAHDESGQQAGLIIAYDGADLHRLRQPFVDAYNRMCGTSFSESEFDDETKDDEIYIDTLMVAPAYRRQGLGAKLISAVEEKYCRQSKPLGLLVDHKNYNARKLYEKVGFKGVGERRFCGVEMLNMKKSIKN